MLLKHEFNVARRTFNAFTYLNMDKHKLEEEKDFQSSHPQ